MRQLTSAELLGLGAQAARANLTGVARGHFMAVLSQDPANILALIWLAYLASTPEESLQLLNRVLALDPANEQARIGVRRIWRRLGAATSPPDQTRPSPPVAPLGPVQPVAPVSQIEEMAAARPRSRSGLAYFLKTLLVMGVMAVLGVTIGLGASTLEPPETLAAWLPTATVLSAGSWMDPVQPLAQPFQPVGAYVPAPAQPASIPPLLVSPPLSQPFDSTHAEAVRQSRRMLELNTLPQSAVAEVKLRPQGLQIEPVPPPAAALTVGFELPVDPTPVDPGLLAHRPAYPGEKWIEVNIATQTVTAWEGNVPVLSFLASTGLPETPTILGTFRIYWKMKKTDMFGFNYYVPEVPYAMYFHGDYALHGTYWHDNFGHRVSRGCVNLSIDNAKKLFEWAGPVMPAGETAAWADAENPGTLVVVHE
jgi:lipoprotein-anchoring transpeptidase ErfK/SrfK